MNDDTYIKTLEEVKPFFKNPEEVDKLLRNFEVNGKPDLFIRFDTNQPGCVDGLYDLTEADRAYCELVAKHLAANYTKGNFPCGGLNLPHMTKEDHKAMASGYKDAVKYAVNRFESGLWSEVRQYIGLSKPLRGAKKPTRERVFEILRYKMIGKTKNAIRRFLYER
jgi:hypothetical protein